ncbi:MAG: hypothetical protein MOB07_29075 [Acidobacteria bacterium]|nr:hypothetical protein [Acidobacteriota bacterium]
MKRRNSKSHFFLAVSALLLAATLAPSSFAQNQPAAQTPAAQQSYWVTETHVKLEMVNEYREFLKSETLPAFKKAGGKVWATWTTAVFGEGGVFWTIRPIDSLKQFDEPNFIVKALGEAGAQAWIAKRGRMIISSRSFMITARPDLGIARKTNEAPKIGVGARNSITPGRTAEYEKGLKENLLPVIGKTNVKGFLVSKVGLGGDPNEYLALALFDSFADLEKFRAVFEKAAAEAKLGPPPAGILTHTEWAVFRYVPELSLAPVVQKAENK